MTAQPSYFCIANLGDADPFTHGGAFVCIDRRGIYDPILLIYDQDFRKRFYVELEPCFRIMSESDQKEILGVGANPFHPTISEWWGDRKSLDSLADFCGKNLEDVVNNLICSNTVTRASVYLTLIDYHGIHEFDSYPHQYENEESAKLFCDKMLAQIEESKLWWDGYFAKDDK